MISVLLANLASVTAALLFQGVLPLTVDLLSPGDEGFAGIPSNLRCVDVFVNLNQNTQDVWTAAGIKAAPVDLGIPGPDGNAWLRYSDGDPNSPLGRLLNPGYQNRFLTSISRPRGRDSQARFEDAGAAIAGGYSPPSPTPTTDPDFLSVAYYRNPPATFGSPSDDGFIARISVDISQITDSGVDLTDYSNWGAGFLSDVPSAATLVLRSGPSPGNVAQGIAMTSFDYWQGIWISWGLWYVPEPSGALMAVPAGLYLIRRKVGGTPTDGLRTR